MFFLTIQALYGFFDNNLKLGFIGLGFLLLTAYTFYYFGTIFKLFFQYYRNDKNREISIDFKNNKTIIKNVGEIQSIVFNEQNLQRIEFNVSTKNSKHLTSGYNFVKLITVDKKEYYVTNLIMDSYELIDFLPKVKRVMKMNSINYLR